MSSGIPSEIYHYDAQRRLESIEYFDAKGQISQKLVIEYDVRGLYVKQTLFQGDEKEKEVVLEWLP